MGHQPCTPLPMPVNISKILIAKPTSNIMSEFKLQKYVLFDNK